MKNSAGQEIANHFIELDSLLPYLQKPSTCTNPEPDQYSPKTDPISLSSSSVLSSNQHLGLPIDFFPSDFPSKAPLHLTSPLQHCIIKNAFRRTIERNFHRNLN